MTFGVGPAGTGKTYVALGVAAMMLQNKEIDVIYVIRSPVEAGEKLGFLPGTDVDKIDPYFTTVKSILYRFLGRGVVDCAIKSGKIVFAPFAFLRSGTIDRGFVLVEEAQNTTITQMKLALSRVGHYTRYCIAGDDRDQFDLPEGVVSGLTHAVHLFGDMDNIGVIKFEVDEIVRSPRCKEVIKAYRSVRATNTRLEKVS